MTTSRPSLWRSGALLLLSAFPCCGWPVPSPFLGMANAQTQFFPDGGAVNLATARGAIVTTSGNIEKGNDPQALLYGPHAYEVRFGSKYGGAWTQIELPQSFQVSRLRLVSRSVIKSIGFEVKVSATPLDAEGWRALAPVAQFKDTLAPANGPGNGYATVEFPATSARFVRVEITGHNGSERGEPGQEHPDLVLRRIQLFGPNKIPITPLFSSVQNSWGSSAISGTFKNNGFRTEALTDDSTTSSPMFGNEISFPTWGAAGPPAGVKAEEQAPAQITVTLGQRSLVEAVALSAIHPARSERPLAIKVYSSPAEQGDLWQLQAQTEEKPKSIFQELAFARPVLAKRIRFDIEKSGDTRVNAQGVATSYLSELFVYGTAQPPTFQLTLKKDVNCTAVVYDAQGNKLRTLWEARAMKAGSHNCEWDGFTDGQKEMPKGNYQLRLFSSEGRYENVAALGNTGLPPDAHHHMVTSVDSVFVDEEGAIYSANGWDEYAHDWKKWDKDGKALMDARAQIRNGTPNGLPYRITVDDKYIYAGFKAHGDKNSQWVQRFDRKNGNTVKWRGAHANGHIQLLPPGTPGSPIADVAIKADTLLVGDNQNNRVLKFDKATGTSQGEFSVPDIAALGVQPGGEIWVATSRGALRIYDLNGKQVAEPISGLGNVTGFSFGPGNTLYIADNKAKQVLIYTVNGLTAQRVGQLGSPARPGDARPDQFYTLRDVAAGADGSLVTINRLPMHGTRMTRWTPTATGWAPQWEQLGLEFTGNANYATDNPDEVISSYFHRYKVDKKTGQWTFDGNMFTGGLFKRMEWHGAPRWVKLGGNWFLFMALGDGMQVFKRRGHEMRFVAAVGGKNPEPDGSDIYNNRAPGLWSWTDANDDAQVQEEEVTWFKKPGEAKYNVFGLNADPAGNLVYAEHHSRVGYIIPMTLNAGGNPVYDWAKQREIIPRSTPEGTDFYPLMAVRNKRGDVYAYGRSNSFPAFPGTGGAWMGGWVLAKYDATGKQLWIQRLARHCTGMDLIPPRNGGDGDDGVICGYFMGEILHYTADGLLAGRVSPGAPAAGITGLLDNTGSIAVNRDPRDGILDVFAEEDLLHRVLWYRIDDSKMGSTTQPITLR